MTTNEINADTREARIIPLICLNKEDSSSSSSSDSSGPDDSSDEIDPPTPTANSTEDSHSNDSRCKGGRRKPTKHKRKKRQSKWTTYWSRYKHFVQSPCVHFVYDALFYVVFLFLFSYMILCEFTYFEEVEVWEEVRIDRYARSVTTQEGNYTNETVWKNYTSTTSTTTTMKSTTTNQIKNSVSPVDDKIMKLVSHVVVKKPSWIEWLLIYWMFAFAAEEARQVFTFFKLRYFNKYTRNCLNDLIEYWVLQSNFFVK